MTLTALKLLSSGGAYSVDKFYRLMGGWKWWDDEQPDDTVKSQVEHQLAARENQIDIVLSHTCPLKYISKEVFISVIDQSKVDQSTEIWLDLIENRT